jgi:L-alanine-DL-glutamate epimerase-like enolase superfamily enzyme
VDGVISEVEVLLLAVPLPQPFKLGFGQLQHLPRVLLRLTVETSAGVSASPIQAIGEASIDFPFSHYDSWDMIVALRELRLVGSHVSQRLRLLDESQRLRDLDGCWAAQTALNMALDDAAARLEGVRLSHLYGEKRQRGLIVESVGIAKNSRELKKKLAVVLAKGRIPKLKFDDNLEYAKNALRIAAECSTQTEIAGRFGVDCNAKLDLEQWYSLLESIKDCADVRSTWLFAEQPTLADQHGIYALATAKRMAEPILPLWVIADESFTNESHARDLAQYNIALNMKLQKIGGIYRALQLERAAQEAAGQCPMSTVGGTFPMAFGRAYDQFGAACLRGASLPSDGWQPSTDWFFGQYHLAHEPFAPARAAYSQLRDQAGLGMTPDWQKIRHLVVHEPEKEYRRIRATGSGEFIRVETSSPASYGELYQQVTGRSPQWNL